VALDDRISSGSDQRLLR